MSAVMVINGAYFESGSYSEIQSARFAMSNQLTRLITSSRRREAELMTKVICAAFVAHATAARARWLTIVGASDDPGYEKSPRCSSCSTSWPLFSRGRKFQIGGVGQHCIGGRSLKNRCDRHGLDMQQCSKKTRSLPSSYRGWVELAALARR
jgi:hypothetical protein